MGTDTDADMGMDTDTYMGMDTDTYMGMDMDTDMLLIVWPNIFTHMHAARMPHHSEPVSRNSPTTGIHTVW
jgi:hypothetical protein